MCIRDRIYTALNTLSLHDALPISLVQKAVKELAAAMPEMEVLGADANQQVSRTNLNRVDRLYHSQVLYYEQMLHSRVMNRTIRKKYDL